LCSVVGIWPRFIEPNLLFVSRHQVAIHNLPQALSGLKLLHFGDLHFREGASSGFYRRVYQKIMSLQPDLIVFSGDLLTYSQLETPQLAAEFFSNISAPLGVFACLGNHDYSEYSSLDKTGRPVVGNNTHPIIQGFRRLFHMKNSHSKPIQAPLPMQDDVLRLYSDHGVTLLHNETVRIGSGMHSMNLTGLGDITAGQCDPECAFRGWNYRTPGIVVAHSPDSYPLIRGWPGDLVLFSHTHGGQVNIPGIWQSISPMKNKSFKSGIYRCDGRTICVTRGVGATFPFRLFSPPEIVLLELVRSGTVPQEVADPATQCVSTAVTLATSRVVHEDGPR
jgi:predicted MPP superfamily phosphohydrolase